VCTDLCSDVSTIQSADCLSLVCANPLWSPLGLADTNLFSHGTANRGSFGKAKHLFRTFRCSDGTTVCFSECLSIRVSYRPAFCLTFDGSYGRAVRLTFGFSLEFPDGITHRSSLCLTVGGSYVVAFGLTDG
jgi:hypothetical protein